MPSLAAALLLFLAPQEKPAPSAPGLVATVEAPDGTRAFALESKLAGTWPEGHAPSPAIAAERFTIRYDGVLRVPREGRYRFAAAVRGRFVLKVGETRVFGPEAGDVPATDAPAATITSAWIELPPGEVALHAEFEKERSDARLQLLWQSADFGLVPVPATALRHLPAQESQDWRAAAASERGRELFDAHRCVACHARGDARPVEKGPSLAEAGGRLQPAWIYAWLADPQRFRPGTEMPALFSADESGARERADVARFLGSLRKQGDKGVLRGAKTPAPDEGRRLFAKRGCVGCHDVAKGGEPLPAGLPAPGRTLLRALGSKHSGETLAAFLRKPEAIHPSRRMPDLQLDEREARAIAAWLTANRDPAFESPIPATEDEPASVARGRDLVGERCLSCHELPGVPPRGAEGPGFERGAREGIEGCVGPDAPTGRAPRFALPQGARTDLLAFLAAPASPHVSGALRAEARRALARFGCLNCHEKDGAGGGLGERQRALLAGEESLVEQVGPPDLTEVGTKLRPEWMAELFERRARARPWLEARMPHFAHPAVAALAQGLAALDGEELSSEAPAPSADPSVGLVGRDLVGRQAFACVACHDLAGSPASVAFADSRGPDLVLSPGRVRESWFRRWLLDPQALAPGTKMPVYFPDGKSTLGARHGLDAEGQIAALYQYFLLGERAPLPAGLRNQGGWSWVAERRPAILRTPFERAPRSICVGFPEGASFAYDAARGFVREVWRGGFLRMQGTQWTGEHGPYPAPEGAVLWEAAEDHRAWRFLDAGGRELGPKDGKVRFLGYRERGGNFTFRAEVPLEGGGAVGIEERLVAASAGTGARVDRSVRLRGVPPGVETWCFLGEGRAISGTYSTRLDPDGTGTGGGLSSKSSHGKNAPAAHFRGERFPEGTTVETTPAAAGTRAWARIPPAAEMRDLDFRVALALGAADLGGWLPENWSSGPQAGDSFEGAPLVDPSYDGKPVEGKDPFALEEKSYPIEALPVPEETVLQGGGLAFLPDGTLAICTRRGEVWLLENATKAPREFRWRRFARGLHEPLGLAVADGAIHVLQKPEITRLSDTDGDGVADEYACVSAGWELSTNFHEFAFGLERDRDGGFLGTLGLAIVPGGATREEQVFARGSAFRVGPDGRFEVLALGARTPNGTGLDAEGRFYYTDNQGDYIPACKLVEVRRGEFYGQRFALADRDAKAEVTPPVCWFPYGLVSQSSTDVQLEDRAGRFGPFAGQLLVGDLTNSQLLRVQLETVKGRQQGTVWIFRRGFQSGVERLAFGPDDRLYVAQTTGGWGARGGKLFALERVAFTGKAPFEMKSVSLRRDGFEIEFTEPLDPARAPRPADASVEQFHYHYWATYGSPEIDRKALPVTEAALSADGRRLALKVPGLAKDRICEIRLRDVVSAAGERLVHPDAWYTLNEFPD